MLTLAELIGKKIEAVKDDLGLTNEQLGEILGVTRQTVAKYLKGEQIIDSARLFKLAKMANASLSYFMEENSNEFSFMFRADNPQENFNPSFSQFINKKLNAYWDVMKLVDESKVTYIPDGYQLEIEGKSLTSDEKEIIRDIAEKQRQSFGIEGDLNVDLYSVLERNYFHVYTFRYKDCQIDALSAYAPKQGAFILVNDDLNIPEERKLFSVAHELGHIIFHRDHYAKDPEELLYANYQKEINEKVANQFASYFLIPRDILKDYSFYFKKNRFFTIVELIKLKKDFGVSAQAMLLALKDEGYISSGIYGYILKQLKEQGYEFAEPSPLSHIEKKQRLLFVLKSLLLKEEITLNKVAEVLHLDNKEVRRLAKEWSSINGYPEG